MKHTSFQARRSLLTLALMGAFVAPGAYAATYTVDTLADDSNGSTCSLRDAVLSVNSGGDVGGCHADLTQAWGVNDTINLPAGTYRLAKGGLDETAVGTAETAAESNVPDASVGDLDVLKSVKIIGAGSGTTRIEWDPLETVPANTDRIFHIYTTNALTLNVDVVIQGVTLASGKTFEVDLGPNTDPMAYPNLHYYLRRAGGALALGAAANVVEIDTSLTGAANANTGGLGGSTGGESGATAYTLALTDVIIDGNSAQGDGGGAYIAAPTTATNVVLSNNRATTNGGGIYNEGNTSITNSTLSGNRAEGGGGIFTTGSNAVAISRTTFSGNRAIGGGAISNRSGVTVNLVNSTLSGNFGRDVGAGLYTNGSVNLNFVTIANNVAGADSPTSGSGINTFPSGSGVLTLKNVLLAGNKKGLPYDPLVPATDPLSDSFVVPDAATIAALPPANCGTTSGGGGITVTSLGHNLSGATDTTCNITVSFLMDTTDQNNVDPKIGALALNAPGLTQTHALLAGSPALGAGVAVAGVTLDQRGITRDATPDIGAYEEPTIVIPPTTPPTDTTGTTGGGGGGGCTVNPDAEFDPGLLALLATAIGGVFLRRRRQQAARR
ncbi:MAG: choice-of-anchor Q domain-containing protein [Rhodoferax sp.]|uniref:choice-of-anchor Q domain-containing protein n=1 Tax=Rhodoferax sp. TaxID=50421 RepID=UPI00271FB4FE|nr:choice-of-anchor Q domain-containing protein [Rhodoferax sp.]MDO8449332.1 choice-of-anchor Q domain-containing protein [Rhodoferax sp.]